MLAFLTFIGSPLGRVAGYALLALVLLATLAGVKHEWDMGQAARHQVAAIVHVSKVQTAAVVKVDATAAKQAAISQAKIVVCYRTLIQKVPIYVTSAAPCIPWGLVRLHDAAILHVDPSALPLPAGQSDGSCSDVTAAALVAGVLANYSAAEANAQQLTDLQADLAARSLVVAPVPPVK